VLVCACVLCSCVLVCLAFCVCVCVCVCVCMCVCVCVCVRVLECEQATFAAQRIEVLIRKELRCGEEGKDVVQQIH